MKLTGNKIFSYMLAAAFALTLAGCGGGGGMADTTDPDMPTMPDMCPPGQTGTPPDCAPERTLQEMCEDDGGRFEDDGMCTSAEMLAAMVAAATKSANTKTMAINAEGMQTSTDGVDLGGTAGANPIDIAHKDGAVSISVSRGADDDKVDFVKKADLTGADGSTGSMNELGPNDDGVTEIAIVYTDIGAPKATAFRIVHDLDVNTNTDNDDPDVTNEALEIDADNFGMVMLSGVSASSDGTLEYDGAIEDDATTSDVDESADAEMLMGSFDGAAGMYMCNTAGENTCTVVITDGKVSETTNWVFTPADGATVDVADTDYLWYGVWLMKTAQDDGSDEYNDVQTFAGSSLADANNLADIDGDATYEGGAAGVYVRNVYVPSTTGEKELDHATSGHFTAKVNLTATFTGTSVPEDDHDTVKGTIDSFMLSGMEDASGWGVNVDADISGSTFSGTAKGGGEGDGSISGDFHGNDTADTDNDPDTVEVAVGPKAMTGEFNAEFTNGSVAGGFGARKK